MNTQYRHSQPGYLMIIIGMILLVVAAFVYAYGPQPIGIFLCVIGVFILVFGYKLTVEIKDGFLRFWFGPGIFWKNIPLEQIMYCQPFNGIIFGWGIHFGPGGWLYNVSGMKAVTAVLKSGKKIHIGTDEPIRLIEAINAVLRGTAGDETSQTWAEVKTDYLKRVEQVLSTARHPRSFEILADVGSHLDRRFAELEPQQQTWENFQKIVTEMGPPSDYAELVGGDESVAKTASLTKYTAILTLILIAVALGMIVLPNILRKSKLGAVKHPFVNDPEVVGEWVSVDFVSEVNEFKPGSAQWSGDLFLNDVVFKPNGTTNHGWTWTKGWIIDNDSDVRAEYEIKRIDGTTYLFLPWLSGDVTIRHQRPAYYVLKEVSETIPKQQARHEQETAAAIEAAKSWLKLADEGAYSQSWAQAAEYFRKYVSEDQWKISLEAARKPLGKALSRKVINSTYSTSLPGAPDGRYVVIQFETSFENKNNAVETVTPMMESNGQWRVSGYYIK